MRKLPYKTQIGRSMIEMLGVLAIVGVLSIGALAAYSTAMTKYQANQAIDDIIKMISIVKDLYAGKNNYDGLSRKQICDAGVWDKECLYGDQPQNSFNQTISLFPSNTHGTTNFTLYYPINELDRKLRESICLKIMLAGWNNDLGNSLVLLESITQNPTTYHTYSRLAGNLEISISDATSSCDDINYFRFVIE
jgi:Tfp pilus assembly protein PilE